MKNSITLSLNKRLNSYFQIIEFKIFSYALLFILKGIYFYSNLEVEMKKVNPKI